MIIVVTLLSTYFGTIFGISFATILLIIFGYGWGSLPFFYLRIIEAFQNFFSLDYPVDNEHERSIIIKRSSNFLNENDSDDEEFFR